MKKLYLWCMIKVYDFLYKRLADYSAKYQNGFDAVDAFNSRLAEVQLEIFNDLSPYYDANQKIKDLFKVWVKSATGSTDANGAFTPTLLSGQVFHRVVSIGVVDGSGNGLYGVSPCTEGELVFYGRIPQRKPSVSNKNVYYLPSATSTIQLYPKAVINIQVFYMIFPTEAKIAFTYSESDDEDIMAYDEANTTNLAWSNDAANLILYKMLEKYGVNTREQWLSEYARLGVAQQLNNDTK